MKPDTQPTVSRRNLVRALLGRDTSPAPQAPDAAAAADRHATGDAAYAAGDYTAAVAAYRASTRGDLSNAPVRLRLGYALYALGQYIQARVEFEHVLRLTGGGEPMARLCLGLTLLALGKSERAATTLAAFTDSERPELEKMTGEAARLLAAGEAVDPESLRHGIESAARATAFFPEIVSA
ncbi:tetratricopeptide repeat protein [Solidesulfovibrio sp. C21]|uniref:tetratricopeptide repeat protein n=1 Tax=Solidesulfovibrio sp. C21 TaxID=3398613 RepID=UPI0039FCDC1A